MSKRTKLFLIIFFGLLLLLVGVWIFLQPILNQRSAAPQPPSLQNSTPYVPPSNASNVSRTSTSTLKAPSQPPPINVLVQLQNRAKSLTEQIGSGSSQDGFLGYQDAELNMTSKGQQAIRAEQKVLQQAHPLSGSLYTLSTRAVSSVIISGSAGDLKIIVAVETIQTENAGIAGITPSSSAKRVTVTFLKQSGGGYLADRITQQNVDL